MPGEPLVADSQPIQLEAGQGHRKTGVPIVITGTNGALRITNPRGLENETDNTTEDMTGDAASFSPSMSPGEYLTLPENHLDAGVRDVAYLYDAYAEDVRYGTSHASTSTDAVNLHRLIDQVHRSSDQFLQLRVNDVPWS